MWVLHADGSYHNQQHPQWVVRVEVYPDSDAPCWVLYKGATLIGRYDSLESAVFAGPA